MLNQTVLAKTVIKHFFVLPERMKYIINLIVNFAKKLTFMEFSAQNIADILKGKVEGNPDTKVFDVSKIEEGILGRFVFG